MHQDHAVFISCLETLKKVKLTFFSQEDGHALVRTSAPMDYGPRRGIEDQTNRYHFWDYESDEGAHPLSLLPNRIGSITPTDQIFNPAEFVTWRPIRWFYRRDWGPYS